MFKNETLAKKIDEYQELKNQIDVLEAKVNKIKEELIADLVEREVDSYEFIVNDIKHTVSYKSFERANFDTEAFKEKHTKLYEQYSRVNPSFRFACK